MLSFLVFQSKAQQLDSHSSDSIKIIHIVNAENLRQITINDSTILETLAGNAIVKQGGTTLTGDSIVINKNSGIAEVFGNAHINDADTVNTYAQYIKYIGNEQIAYLKNNVKLTDGKAQMLTNDLVYNVKTGIANYINGGKVINGKTQLTSKEATYYSDTRDVFFKKEVELNDPKYHITADSLRYNTYFKNAYFIAPTHIVSRDGIIDTKSGNYNLETGEAVFLDKTIYRDSSKSISGNKIAFDEKSSIIQIEENGKFVDSIHKVIVLGNQILIDKKKNTFLATRKPVMILYTNQDSTYISADTLFSGKRYNTRSDKNNKAVDSTDLILKKEMDTIQYFLGFHHVRIYNDSVQAVSDSLHYSSQDSTFKLFKDPICWNGNTQLKGDTIYLFTENKQAKRVSVFYNAIAINKTKEGFFNQIAGKTMNGYFIEGNLDYIRTKGNPAECIYYPQDSDSAYVGLNRSKGDFIDITFFKKNIEKIKIKHDVSGTMYPMHKIPTDVKKLKNFSWEVQHRPKNKLEIFE